MLDKVVKKNPAVLAMLGDQAEQTEKPEKADKADKPEKSTKAKRDPKKANPRGYERHRGKGGTKPMSYYLPDDIVKIINIRAAKEEVTKSEVVLAALKVYLKDDIKESKKERSVV